jgi:hypothetical protein
MGHIPPTPRADAEGYCGAALIVGDKLGRDHRFGLLGGILTRGGAPLLLLPASAGRLLARTSGEFGV